MDVAHGALAASPGGAAMCGLTGAATRCGRARSQIVVVTELDDAHVDLVQAHVSRELIVVDPLAGGGLTFERGGGRCSTIAADRRLGDVGSVWYRKPLARLRPLVRMNVAAEHRRYSRLAMGIHAELLHTSFRDATWVSDPFAIIRAESKALQLDLAEELGLRVPETVITSDTATATAFLAAQPAAIVKPLCAPGYAGQVTQSFLATRVHGPHGLEEELSGLRWAPAIFQRAIAAIADLRVTIVGDEVFTARIDADPAAASQPGVRDWRYREAVGGATFHADVTLPGAVRRQCLALTHALGLKYAAIDLVIDRDGTIWFLELNPNGQWGFIEYETGLPIAAALAELLTAT